ncbi:hypothetical protein [Enterococcus casseliflavus]|uniref:hypothetical protein n=1 Tax=Enterococcus casseliflavus TaxID=37734 RepID=UPI001432E66D|nr:hypothetical protein [Enterococcus casseliflavus]NKD31117.1 hypothetical protein [Enterococcus casseliflavus]
MSHLHWDHRRFPEPFDYQVDQSEPICFREWPIIDWIHRLKKSSVQKFTLSLVEEEQGPAFYALFS